MVTFGDLNFILDCTHGHRLMQSSKSFSLASFDQLLLILCCVLVPGTSLPQSGGREGKARFCSRRDLLSCETERGES